MYYNTTREVETRELRRKAKNQDQWVLEMIRAFKKPIGASDIHLAYNTVPITSIRRSINTLMNQGKIVESGKKMGMYGRKEYTYKVNE